MFTGLIREFGTVRSFAGERLSVKARHKPKIGDSIAINGACLTVTEVMWGGFAVELSHETQAIMAIENLRGKVHLEPAMSLSDRLEGHIVQGHLDGIGEITRIDKTSKSYDYYIKVPKDMVDLIAPKGSIAVDGVSLTVNDIINDEFRLTIIPHTLNNSLLGDYKAKRKVNIETDLFARYIKRMLSVKSSLHSWSDIEHIQALF
jgi:riboflavin synthase